MHPQDRGLVLVLDRLETEAQALLTLVAEVSTRDLGKHEKFPRPTCREL